MAHTKIAALFPGQGSQYVGMAKELISEFKATKLIFEEASEVIGTNLLKLCNEGPEDVLKLTENAQPAILTTAYAWFSTMKNEWGFSPAIGAGHSLGEYTALLASGALDLAQSVSLVRRRGQLMQSAVPVGKGKMAALLGLDDERVVQLCEKSTQGPHSIVVAANFNAPGQVVIAGHADAVDRAQAEASNKESPFKARKVIELNVSAPFHSPLMTPVATEFEENLKAAKWAPLNFPIISNLDAQARAEGDWPTLLRDQIDHPVLWTATSEFLKNQEVDTYVEMGPGSVLTGLVKRVHRTANLLNCDSLEDFKKVEKHIQENS